MIGFGFGPKLRRAPQVAYSGDFEGAVAAWSVARVLAEGYTGPLFQARRSTDSVTMDIYPDEDGIADVAALTTFLGVANGLLVQVYDQTGKYQHLLSADATRQYTLATAGVPIELGTEARLAAQAASATQGYRATLSAGITGTTLTAYFAGLPNSTTHTTGRLMSCFSASINDGNASAAALMVMQTQATGNDRIRTIRVASTANITISPAAAHAFIVSFDGANELTEAEAYAAGGAGTFASTAAFAVTQIGWGTNGPGTFLSATGSMAAEAAVWSTALDAPARAARLAEADTFFGL